ncbi:Pentatricopeptide repeat-containing protein [Thalictrum thalictroides]|uniref:Pentatricopeptide repeat-containing protein n=3 Tax=Thalictrum thalictroides TaxID=46969 RepID=A0A7J6X0Y4_THATH|nr:Pentatricopeptide repeat-containing protein [Thalictrum thalictroides]
MCVRGISFSTLGFGVFIGRFCRVLEFEKILGLIDEVKNRGVFSGINGSIVAVLIVDGLCLAFRLASRVLNELRVRDCKPDFMAYRIVAEAFQVQGQLVETEKVLKRKSKFGVSPRANDYREFILNLVSEKWIQEAKELGEVITGGNFPIEEDVLNDLIGSVSAIDPDSAVLFFKFMSEKDLLFFL